MNGQIMMITQIFVTFISWILYFFLIFISAHFCGDYSEEVAFAFSLPEYKQNYYIHLVFVKENEKKNGRKIAIKSYTMRNWLFPSFILLCILYMHCYFPTLDILKLCGKGYWKAIAMHALPSSRDWFWLKRIFANAV